MHRHGTRRSSPTRNNRKDGGQYSPVCLPRRGSGGDLPESGRGFEAAWAQFVDPEAFRGPFGITTAERRDPRFRSHGCCGCEWDGAVWPFATSQTLVGLANLLREGDTSGLPVSRRDYFAAFLDYTRSHRFDGRPYVGEYLDETTGQWLKGRQERSRDYLHSAYADLLIGGVLGVQPRADGRIEIDPLLPEGTWDWFCLEGVKYHGRMLTLLWDRDGSRFGRGPGFQVLAEGRPVARSDRLGLLRAAPDAPVPARREPPAVAVPGGRAP